MSKIAIALALTVSSLLFASHGSAQTTNEYPLTILETTENTTGQLLVKSTEPVGYAPLGGATISVACKEDALIASGRKLYGLVVDIQSGQQRVRTIIDYDEINPLLQALDYLIKVDWSVTSLSTFNAGYTTKEGLRFAAFSNKRQDKIEFVVTAFQTRLPSSPSELSQLYNLVYQAKTRIDALREVQQK